MHKVNNFHLKNYWEAYCQIQQLIINQSIKNELYDTVRIKSSR
jgi:hypothetical protein